MTNGLLGSETALAEAYELALVDLDGVAYRGPDPIDHADTSLTQAAALGMQLVYVTNNASREPEAVAAQLSGLGIATGPEQVMTAAQAAAELLKTRLAPQSKVLVIGGLGLRTAVANAGFTIVESADDDPAAVAQGFAPELGWAQLAEAAYAVSRGAWHVASNLDLSLPTARGYAPGNGSLVGAVVNATGEQPESSGKPSPKMYDLAVERTGAESVLVIGDRLDTDLAGARSGGYPGLHVLTGVNTARDDVLAPMPLRPHFIGADLRSLLESHPQPELSGNDWWVCRGSAARVVSGRLELDASHRDGNGDDVDIVRAACASAWAAADAGVEIDQSSVPEFEVGSH